MLFFDLRFEAGGIVAWRGHFSGQSEQGNIAGDWCGGSAAATSVLHNNGNGNFRVVIGGIVDKERVVTFLPR